MCLRECAEEGMERLIPEYQKASCETVSPKKGCKNKTRNNGNIHGHVNVEGGNFHDVPSLDKKQ